MGGSERQTAEHSETSPGQARHSDCDPESDPVLALDATWQQLARTVQAGREARSALLSDKERAAHRSAIRRYHAALEQRQQHRDSALAAARILARTESTDQVHRQAAHNFRIGLQHEEIIAGRLTALGTRAAGAHAELREDDTTRIAKRSILEAGAAAEKQLKRLLRDRLAEAFHPPAPLPEWFTTVLGPAAPVKDPEECLDLAVRVLAYRATYGITDHPLGP